MKDNIEALNAFIEFYDEIGAKRFILQKYYSNISNKIIKRETLPEKYNGFINILKVRGYSPRTIRLYSSALKQVHQWTIKNHKITIDQLNPEIALKYFLCQTDEANASYSTVKSRRFSVEFYLENINR